jgi:hypothetical protein
MAQSALRALMQGGPAPAGMASAQTAIQNAAQRPQPKPMGQQVADVLGGVALPLSTVPVVGDIAGLGADAAMYANYPEERTALNYGLTLAGILPFVPSAAGVRAVEGALDMSQAARMQRAQEQEYDERMFYHGGASDIDEFRPGSRGNYFTDNPRIADIYATNAQKRLPSEWSNANPNVMPVRLRGPALVVSDQKDGSGGWYANNLAEILGLDVSQIPVLKRAQVLRDEAKRQGYGFLEIQDMDDLGGRQSQFVALDPKNIRSVNAEFNPANRGSANLMAGVMGGAVGLSALRQLMPQQEQE